MILLLKDVVLSITENYHNLGHHGSEVDAMMDSVAGMGHRLKQGHDMQGLIESYHLQGIEGIGLWFDHMLKDFTSPAGIPLPFAEAIYNVSGMPMDTAIDWLTVNAYDAGALITQEVALKLFKNHKKAYKTTFLLGSAIGIVDDNPLIVVTNTLRLIQSGKFQQLLEAKKPFIEKAGKIAGRTCMGTAVITLSAGTLGLNIPEKIEEVGHWLDLVEEATTVSDIVDGLSTFGVGILLSKGVKAVANSINDEPKRELQQKEEKLALCNAVKQLGVSGASPMQMALLLDEMKDQKIITGDES